MAGQEWQAASGGPWLSSCETSRTLGWTRPWSSRPSVTTQGLSQALSGMRQRIHAVRALGVVTEGKSGIQALCGKGSAKDLASDAVVTVCYCSPRSIAAKCGMVGLDRYGAPTRRTMCHSAVIALYGRTPREGTAGHVASRRGLERNHTARRPPRGTHQGPRAAGRWSGGWSRSGPWCDARKRRLGRNTLAMPGSRTGAR